MDNIFSQRNSKKKKARLLYEWVEYEVDETGSNLATEVREQADVLFGDFWKLEED